MKIATFCTVYDTVICGMSDSFSILSLKLQYFREEGGYRTWNVCLDFLYKFHPKHFPFCEKNSRENLYRSSRTVPVIPVKFERHHLSPWIRSFDLLRHRHIVIVSWGVHDLFFERNVNFLDRFKKKNPQI